MAKPGAELAKFLRMKRQLLRPEMLLLDTQQRATADFLLCADVATAVGVPLADYEHLENGADNPPSEQVLHALIEVLDLTDDEAAELGRIVAIMGAGNGATVHPQLMALLDSWELTPAFICDHRLTVLSSNPIARVLSPMFDGGTNVLRATISSLRFFTSSACGRTPCMACPSLRQSLRCTIEKTFLKRMDFNRHKPGKNCARLPARFTKRNRPTEFPDSQ